MKKLFFVVLLISHFFGYAQYTLIPDANFEKALIGLGIDNGAIDGKVLTANVSGLTTLGISDTDATNLIGIQDFTSLVELQCPRNKLTSLDISKNTLLTLLSCWGNKLTSLDTSKNTNLKILSCFQNELISLDVSKNSLLSQLYCSWNQLTTLNLRNGNNKDLFALNAWSNPNLKCIQVDNKTYSETSWLPSSKDTATLYSEDCSKTAAPISPPKITATGNQTYCPGTSLKIVETISITNDPLEPDTDAIYIQIAAGYINGQDQLTLANPTAHSNITTSWDATAGKLKLYSPTGIKIPYTDFVSAIKDVEFKNSSSLPSGIRDFSITLGQANYLPSTGHYYQFVSNVGITWTSAKTAAEALNYYGLKGYLATLSSLEEAKISGEQAQGAGWIGGSDSVTEGEWRWVTGPEGLANGGTGIVFWNGTGNGSTPNFAYWNSSNSEPNNLGDEDYAHIKSNNVPGIPGSWNDLSNTGNPSGDYQPKGFIVEFGGMPGDPVLKISASTSMKMSQLTVTTPRAICFGEKATLQASAGSGTINWYDALTGGVLLQTGTGFTTPALTTDTIYYVDNGCSSRTPLLVPVNPLPIINPVIIPRQCDNDQDGIFVFNTSSLESTLLNGLTNVTVTYFDSLDNPLKDSNGNLITSPFPASFSTASQIIKAVVTENSPSKCATKTNISFIVDDLPEAFVVPAALTTACDDESIPSNQDGIFPFNTSTFEATILRGQTGMKVSYFDKNGTQLSSPLPNPFLTSSQSVSVKVENPINATCFATTLLNFIVNPLPIVKDVTIIQCDTDLISDGKTLFNLTVNNDAISANYTNETFTYYSSFNGANNAVPSDLIPNDLTFANTKPTLMDIWSRVSNKLTGCASVAKITLKVPATNIPPNYKIPFAPVCDDFLDVNGNNNANSNKRDGVTTFDFSATKAIILAQLPTNQVYTINYYKNESDALAETNVITNISNYRNIGYPNSQDIWIRIDSDLDNACYGLGPYLTLNVEALPVANTVTILRQCDDNNDGIFTFNTSSLESDLVKGQTNVTVTYFDQANNPLKDAIGVLITSPFPANFTSTSQTITAVVTNTSAQNCFDETNITFIVDVSPQAFPVLSTLTTTCDDEANPINQDGKFAFDTSTFETTILGGQTGMIVKYYDSNNVLLPSPLPNPFVTKTQNITVNVQNPLNTICTASTTLNFVVNPVPNIDLNLDGLSNELVCSNLSTFIVTLDAGILDGSSSSDYDYVWTKDGLSIGSNFSTLDVNTVGNYTVKVINKLGCSKIRPITVTASNIASIVSVDIVDLTDVNTVTVNVTGPGDYEYSLDESNGFWQDSNFFNNVQAGIHTVYVNDKNGCGLVYKEIVIVGAPKFFTPNGDGYNDYWSVKGVTESFNSKSIIYIFDRYGKLLKQWVPSLKQGWDGTFNGVALPADDYWFTLKLEDGRETKGHFSLKR
ncbi:T9SS type B sorting domain-containing protein [Flavobacterium sp.]|uniref:T9SS type B sorting domain-containing protein n=1 Tax=Flavobacterium sp. TaxID=239 RepID=UPI00286DF3D2|nr:T9SS type B sorting domain-containing protein [Flavobacterium sp.]